MKKFYLLLPFFFLYCKPISSVVNQTVTSNIASIAYKVEEEDVAKTLKYLASDELEGRRQQLSKLPYPTSCGTTSLHTPSKSHCH